MTIEVITAMASIPLEPSEFPALHPGEAALLLASWASGDPVVGALIDMLLGTIFAGPSAWLGPGTEPWIGGSTWAQHGAVLHSIGAELRDIAPKGAAEQHSAFDGSIRETCLTLRGALHDAASASTEACAHALDAYFVIAFLDLVTQRILVQLDQELEESGDTLMMHSEEYGDTNHLYTGEDPADRHALYPRLRRAYAAWRLTTFQRRAVHDASLPCSYEVHDAWKDRTLGGGQVESPDEYAAFVAGKIADELDEHDRRALRPLQAMEDPEASPLILKSGAHVRLGVYDDPTAPAPLGPAFAVVPDEGASQLGLQRDTPTSPLGEQGLFTLTRTDGWSGPLNYGEAVIVRSKPYALCLGVDGRDGARVSLAPRSSGADAQAWILVSPFGERLAEIIERGGPVPVTMLGHFLLQHATTRRYLGVMRPPCDPADPDRHGYFVATSSLVHGAHYLFTRLGAPATTTVVP